MAHLTAKITKGNGDWVLKLPGNVGSGCRHLLWPAGDRAALLKKLVEANTQKLVIDLAAAERLDSQALKLLLGAHQEFTRQNIQIVLRNPDARLHRLLQILQYVRIFVIEFSDD